MSQSDDKISSHNEESWVSIYSASLPIPKEMN